MDANEARRRGLSPARGILLGLVLGVLLWFLAGLISIAIVRAVWGEVDRKVVPALSCPSPLFGPGPDGPIVECPR